MPGKGVQAREEVWRVEEWWEVCGGMRWTARSVAVQGGGPAAFDARFVSFFRTAPDSEVRERVESRQQGLSLSAGPAGTAIPKQRNLRRVAAWGKRFQQNAHLAGHTSCFEKIVDVQASLGPRKPCQLPSVRPHPTYY